jgi:hypothetical protein
MGDPRFASSNATSGLCLQRDTEAVIHPAAKGAIQPAADGLHLVAATAWVPRFVPLATRITEIKRGLTRVALAGRYVAIGGTPIAEAQG